MVKIILDSREASSNPKLKTSLEKLTDVDSLVIEELNVGDILVGNYLIERKSTPDLLTRNKDGSLHIFRQLDRLKMREKEGFQPILLIEGYYDKIWKFYPIRKQKMKESQVFGLINSIVLKYRIPVVKVDTKLQLTVWIKNLVKRAQDPTKTQLNTLRTTPQRNMSLEDHALYVLQGYPGVGPVKSRKLLEEFNSIEGLFRCLYCGLIESAMESRESLEDILGKKYAGKFREINSYQVG